MMLSQDELDRVKVVLVRARNPSNIGAAARAMYDFGFSRMRVVNEFPAPFEGARSAVDASAVLANAVACTSVAEAVGDCTLVVGTTAVGERNLRHELLPLPEAAGRVRAEMHRGMGRVALLFGSEKTGLSNEEMSHCNWLLTVPMQQYEGTRHPSMNLGQAVAVCLYELVRGEMLDPSAAIALTESSAKGEGEAAAQLATAADVERLAGLLSQTLEETEYARHHAGSCDPVQVRRLVRRMGLNASDAPVWMGILRQILWKIGSTSRRP